MTPSQHLLMEAKAIRSMLKILDVICNKLDAGETVKASHLKMIVNFLRVYVDACHNRKEELILFPQLEKAGVSTSKFKTLIEENELGREYLRELSKAMDHYQKGELEYRIIIKMISKQYIELENYHLDMENKNVIPMIKERLTDEHIRNLEDQFLAMENEEFGNDHSLQFHEAMSQVVNKLEKLYPA